MAKRNPLQRSLLLLTLAAAAVGLTWFVLKPGRDKAEADKDKASLLYADLERPKLLEIKLEGPGGAFTIKRKADKAEEWLVSEGAKTYDADRATVDGLLSTVLAAKKENTLPVTDLASVGLNPPHHKLVVGTAKELQLGLDTPVDYLVYAKWSDSPEVFLTSRSLRFGVDKKLSELRNRKVFDAKLETLAAIEVQSAGFEKTLPYKLRFEKNEAGEWKLAGPKPLNVEVAEIKAWLDGLNTLTVLGFESEVPADRAKLGFGRPVATLRLFQGDGKAAPIEWQLVENVKWENKTKTSKFFFARLDAESTFEVADTYRDNFRLDAFRFRPKAVTEINKADVTAITIGDGKETFDLKRVGADWKIGDAPAKADVVNRLLDGLTGLKAEAFEDNLSSIAGGFANPTRTVEFRGQKDGAEKSLGLLVFGAKRGLDKVLVRAVGMDAPGVVTLKLEDVVPAGSAAYRAAAPAAEAPSAPTPEKGKPVKLEATVSSTKDIKKLPEANLKPNHEYTAEITLESGRKIKITFEATKSPYTVSNFVHLARNKFYDGVKFHRVIKGFMAQGGDPMGTGTGGPGWDFADEKNDLRHVRGVLSMANRGPNTNGSQFFIVTDPSHHLDGKHTIFGKVTEGLEVVDAVKQGEVMKSVEIFERAL